MIRRFLTCVSLLITAASPALGWGADGHRIIGWIAYQRLDPAAKAEIDRLLATEKTDLPEAGVWADAVARKQPEYRYAQPLHYANVEKGAKTYDPARDRPAAGDVVSGIERYAAVLADKSKPDAERLEALRFLAHFIGDIHQPLHVGYGEDKGGNKVQVQFFGTGTNLHAVWDAGIIEKSVTDWKAEAKRLNDGVKPERVRELTGKIDAVAWAQESYALAVKEAYAGVGAGDKLDRAYVEAKMPVVEAQLTAAGVRLGAVLNRALAGGKSPFAPEASAPGAAPATGPPGARPPK